MILVALRLILLNFLFIFLFGCKTLPKPTGDDRLDVYLQKIIKTPNVVVCDKFEDAQSDLHVFVCAETELNRVYYIPFEEWEDKHLDDYFTRISKRDLLDLQTFYDMYKNKICETAQITCEYENDYKPLEVLIPYLRVESEVSN